MKTCKRCNIEKPLSDFNKQTKTKDGFQTVCRDCMKEIRSDPAKKERDAKKAKERDQSPEGRATRAASRAKHLAIPGNKEKKVAWFKAHNQKPEIKAASAERHIKNMETPGFKEKKSAEAKIRNATDEGKARNAANRATYLAIPGNKEKKSAYSKERNALPEVKAINSIKGAARYAENREQILDRQKKHNETRKDEISEYHREWYKVNKDEVLIKCSIYQKNNRGRYNVLASNRRARILDVGGELSPEIQKKLFELQRGCCAICKKKLSTNTKYQHMDHVVPINPRPGDKAGTNEDSNMQLLCQPCNNRKHNKDPLKFMQEMGYLI